MKLTESQIDQIISRIDNSRITIKTLRDDLLDHLCCVLEEQVGRGKDFGESLEMAIHELAPEGLDHIHRQTIYLLNSTKIIRMKRIMYAIGLLSAMSFVLGWTFGILHWPGSYELSAGGFLVFVFVYLPMLAIDHYKTGIHRVLSEKLKLILGMVSGALIGASIVFKILHLAGAVELLVTGSFLFVFGFLPFLFFSYYKKSIS